MKSYYELEKLFYQAVSLKNKERAMRYLQEIERVYPLCDQLEHLKKLAVTLHIQQDHPHIQGKTARRRTIRFGVLSTLKILVALTVLIVGFIFVKNKVMQFRIERANNSQIEDTLTQAKTYEENDDLEEALREFNIADKLSEGDAEIRTNIVRVCSEIGARKFDSEKYTDAIGFFQKALKYDPENVEVKVILAKAFYRIAGQTKSNKHYQEALEVLKSIEDGDVSAAVLLSQGFIYIRMNQRDEAILCWRKIQKDFPDSAEVSAASKILKDYGYY